MKLTGGDRGTAPGELPPPSLGALVHGVVNSTASISFSASALRTGGKLSESDLETLARIEQAAELVADTVKRFATAAPASRSVTPKAGATVDLYEICCEIANERRGDGHPIFCRAFGDSRGHWNRAQLVDLVKMMVDSALTYLGVGASLTLIANGLGRHVRLSLQGLGTLSREAKQACLQIPSRIDPSLAGLMAVTASRGPGTVISMHLPR